MKRSVVTVVLFLFVTYLGLIIEDAIFSQKQYEELIAATGNNNITYGDFLNDRKIFLSAFGIGSRYEYVYGRSSKYIDRTYNVFDLIYFGNLFGRTMQIILILFCILTMCKIADLTQRIERDIGLNR